MPNKLVSTKNFKELNKKFNCYADLINYYKQFNREYFEKRNIYCETHHIIPRCEGGNNYKENLICLDLEHHILAHYLRAKELESTNKSLARKHYLSVKRSLCSPYIADEKALYEKMPEVIEAKQKYIDITASLDIIWITNGKKNKKIPTEETKEFLKNGWWEGRTFTSPAGKIWISDGKHKEYLPKEEAEKFLKENPTWFKGMGKTKKHVITKEMGSTRGKIWVHKGEERKNILPEEKEKYLNEGWELGSGNAPNAGRRIIHNGDLYKIVKKEELEKYLNEGWELGVTQKSLERAKLTRQKHQLPQTQSQAQDD